MAHLSCVGETREGLAEILDRFAATGVENVLALRGDPPKRRGRLRAARGRARQRGRADRASSRDDYEFTIGGACFPEVHPEAPSLEQDLAYLKTKVDAGASFLITQLFFDNDVYFEFVDAAREAGIDVPIIPGVIPIASYGQVAADLHPLRRDDPGPARSGDAGARRRHRGRARCSASPTPPASATSCWPAARPASTSTRSTGRPGPARCSARCAPRARGSARRPRLPERVRSLP